MGTDMATMDSALTVITDSVLTAITQLATHTPHTTTLERDPLTLNQKPKPSQDTATPMFPEDTHTTGTEHMVTHVMDTHFTGTDLTTTKNQMPYFMCVPVLSNTIMIALKKR